MNYSFRQKILQTFLVSAFLVMSGLSQSVLAAPTYTDDTEVLMGAALGGADPNVLLILDTSQSMNNQRGPRYELVPVDVDSTPDYDPDQDYDGPCSNPGAIYIGLTNPDIFSADCTSSDIFQVPVDLIHCQKALDDLPIYGLSVQGTIFWRSPAIDPLEPLIQGPYPKGYWDSRWWQMDANVPDPVDGPRIAVFPLECITEVGYRSNGSQFDTDGFQVPGVHGDGRADYVYLTPALIDQVDPGVEHDPWAQIPSSLADASYSTDGGVGYRTLSYYTDNYLGYLRDYYIIEETDPGDDFTRLEQVQNVLAGPDGILQTIENVRVGLMRLDPAEGQDQNSPIDIWNGGPVEYPITDIDAPDARSELIDTINAYYGQGFTPLSETFYEAVKYYRGDSVEFGFQSAPQSNADSYSGGEYISPIQEACQKNYVVVLTDGVPTHDREADTQIQSLIGVECDIDAGVNEGRSRCLDDYAKYVFNNPDFIAAGPGPSALGLPEAQPLETFTIAFRSSFPYLEEVATAGFDHDNNPDTAPLDGYFEANDAFQLENAFQAIFASIQTDYGSFTAPSSGGISSTNRLVNRPEFFTTAFVPDLEGRAHWDGNVKMYMLTDDGDGNISIRGQDGKPAFDKDGTGNANTRSYWSATDDGIKITEGGFASRLGEVRNDIYTNNVAVPGSKAFLQIKAPGEDNSILKSYLVSEGIATDDAQADTLLELAYGIQVDPDDADFGNPMRRIGDPLHSTVLPIQFAQTGEALNPNVLAFSMTNDGFVHAIEPYATPLDTRLERFSFIPQDLLGHLQALYTNPTQTSASFEKAYGLDGKFSRLIADDDGDGLVDDDEDLYVYFGMRRGGKNYYSIAMPRRSFELRAPEMAWTIKGGVDADFEELGQTWSEPTVAKIGFDGGVRDVLIFGGGNDRNQDITDRIDQGADQSGRAIFIVDAKSGERIFMAGGEDSLGAPDLEVEGMDFAIPSDIKVLDINLDGLADRLYFGDTGGQLFRFDINNADQDGSGMPAITGGVMAKLSSDAIGDEAIDEAGNLKFYEKPSVALVRDRRVGSFLAIGIGTGSRSNPLGMDVNDQMYMVKDRFIYTAPINTDTDEVDYNLIGGDADGPIVNDNLIPIMPFVDPTPLLYEAIRNALGWRLDFSDAGEKVLASPFIVDNRVFFTTYTPADLELTCDPQLALGEAREYEVDLLTGTPINPSDTPTYEDRYRTLAMNGIPPEPTIISVACSTCEGGRKLIRATGKDTKDPGISVLPIRTYWHQCDSRNADGDCIRQ